MTSWMPIPETIKRKLVNEAVAEAKLGGLTGDAFLRALCDALARRHAQYNLGQGVVKGKDGVKRS